MPESKAPKDSTLHGVKDYSRPVEIHEAGSGMYMFTITAPAGESIHEAITRYGNGYMSDAEWSDPFRFRFPDGKGGYYSRYIIVGMRG